MSSADFKTVFVIDDRLACTNEIKYAVNQGGQAITTQDFNAISQGTSSHTYSVQLPSENVICDRRVMWSSTIVVKVVGQPSVGEFLVDYGRNDAFAPMPLHACCSTIQASINNTTVSTNIQDTLPAILRMNDVRELQRFNSLTPTAPDTYKSYADGVNANNNPLGSYVNISDNDIIPRGAYPVRIGNAYDKTTGVVSGAQVVGDGANSRTTFIAIDVSEPLLISPFLSNNTSASQQGFYGISNMNFTMNIAGASRVFRSARNYFTLGANAGVFLEDFKGSKLTFQFITSHSNLLLPSRNVVPKHRKIRNGHKSRPVMVC